MRAQADDGAVVYRRDAGIDAIDEHSRLMVGALRELGRAVSYYPDGLREVFDRGEPPRWVLLQYNPFCYGRWGFAPQLLRDVARLRRARVPIALMVHEAWLDITDWRTGVMGAWQRIQLRALAREAGAVMTSTEAIARVLGVGAMHVPVASNIAPVAVTPQQARERLGIGRAVVVSLFGRAHPSRALGYAEAAIAALAEAHGPQALTVLNIGADAPALSIPSGVQIITCGRQVAAEVSIHLRAADLMLLPLTDGVSTRRSTLMAALAHHTAVLALRGKNTDGVLLDAAGSLVMTPVGDVPAYAAQAVRLSRDPHQRRSVGAAGGRLYEDRFDWPIVARRVASVLDAVSGTAGDVA